MTSPAPVAPAPTAATPDLDSRKVKMQLRQEEVMVTPTGTTRYPAGAVLIVDYVTAERWYENNIADLAPPDAEAYGEVMRRVKREEFARRAQVVEGEGVFDEIVSRQSFNSEERQLMPPPMPVPGRRGPGRPPANPGLSGAVVNDRMDDDED
jgi:hypothetical protein